MGADQSSPLKRKDEFSSYSVTKPINGDEVKSSPRLQGRNRFSRKDTDKAHDIIVVKEGTAKEEIDPELRKLANVPVFVPILHNSITNPLQDPELLEKLDTKQLTALCSRYQEHLKHCAEAVAFDQNALCVRIKEIDFTVQTLYNVLQERQKKYAKYAEQIQKVSEVHSVLNKVKMNVEQTLPVMERLNSVLPPDDQLEPFSMKPVYR